MAVSTCSFCVASAGRSTRIDSARSGHSRGACLADVGNGPGVLAHKNRAEARDDPEIAQAIHALLKFSLDSCGGRRAVKNPRGSLPGSPHCSSPAYRGCLSVSFLTRARRASTPNIAARRALRQRRTDDVCDLREVLGVETARREGGGADAQARGDGRMDAGQRAPRCG